MALDKDDPAAVRRYFREVVAHAVVRGSGNRLGGATPAVVEGNTVEVVLNGSLVRIVGAERFLLAYGIGIHCLCARKDDVFAVGAPHAVGLHVAGIVGARERLACACGPAVPLQNPSRRIEDLEKPVILEVGDVIRIAHIFAG